MDPEKVAFDCRYLNKSKEKNDTILPMFPPDDEHEIYYYNEKQHGIWYRKPEILWKYGNWRYFVPNKDMDTDQVLNAMMRFALLYFAIVSLWKSSFEPIYVPFIVGIFTYFIYEYNTDPKEMFCQPTEAVLPTKDNPFMNTLPTEVGTEKIKKTASDITHPKIKKDVEYLFNQNLYKDTKDVYNNRNSQRMFFTMPNTNEYGIKHGDTVKFANWLFNKHEPTCKEDSTYCAGKWAPNFSEDKQVRSHRKLLPPQSQTSLSTINELYIT